MPRQKPRTTRKPNRPRTLRKEQREFVEAYSKTGNLLFAAKMCNLQRVEHDRWIAREKTIAEKRGDSVEEYPYHAAYAAAEEDSLQRLEAEARRRAERGVKKLKFCRGKPITNPETDEQYYELEYDTALMMFLLKALNPERYRERSETRKRGKTEPKQAGKVTVYIPENRRGEKGGKRTAESGKPNSEGGTSCGKSDV